MLHMLKGGVASCRAEDAVHILQDVTIETMVEEAEDDEAPPRDNDVVLSLRGRGGGAASAGSETGDANSEDPEDADSEDSDTSNNIEEITVEASRELSANKCACKHKGFKYCVHKLRICVHSRPCTICVYLFLTLVLLASLVSLIVIGVLILAPFRRARDYHDGYCVALRNPEEIVERRCSCGKGCSSTYPCLLVKVHLRGVHNDSTSSSILYENESMLLRKCSYYPPCKSSRIANEKAVRDYELKFGSPGKTFPCLYNPDNPKEVIRTRRFHLSHVIHGMVWSSLVFLLSLATLVFAVRKKGCDFV